MAYPLDQSRNLSGRGGLCVVTDSNLPMMRKKLGRFLAFSAPQLQLQRQRACVERAHTHAQPYATFALLNRRGQTRLVPADTSECERIFSLMNDIKTAERSRMSQKNLKNLMLWHALATKVVEAKKDGKVVTKKEKLVCKDVPVMAILQEFRTMAGVRGRKRHTPQPVPSYEYEKHRSAVKVDE